jgi:NAD(P)-dependent dehydrogenase (short-subunit alcohol dehydrogenase family)
MIDRTVSSIAEHDMTKKQAGAAEKRDELAESHCTAPEALNKASYPLQTSTLKAAGTGSDVRKARGRIVQISTRTASLPLPFNGPSGASKAAMEVFATVYRAELKPFGIDVVVVAAAT